MAIAIKAGETTTGVATKEHTPDLKHIHFYLSCPSLVLPTGHHNGASPAHYKNWRNHE